MNIPPRLPAERTFVAVGVAAVAAVAFVASLFPAAPAGTSVDHTSVLRTSVARTRHTRRRHRRRNRTRTAVVAAPCLSGQGIVHIAPLALSFACFGDDHVVHLVPNPTVIETSPLRRAPRIPDGCENSW